MELFVSGPEALDPDVYGSNHDGYRYSRYTCSAETCISCPYPRSLVFLPSYPFVGKAPNKKAAKVSSSAA
jgi:hypothetical protein